MSQTAVEYNMFLKIQFSMRFCLKWQVSIICCLKLYLILSLKCFLKLQLIMRCRLQLFPSFSQLKLVFLNPSEVSNWNANKLKNLIKTQNNSLKSRHPVKTVKTSKLVSSTTINNYKVAWDLVC